MLRQQYDVGDAVLVGLVGRVEKAKEQLGFVQIAGEVLKKTREGRLLYRREDQGPLLPRPHSWSRSGHAGLSGHVHFTGHREDIPEVLAGLDVLVSLSGGSVRYEAMMCGIPVVCAWSRQPEESRCIRHNDTGFLVPDRSIEAVSQVLLDVIADGDLRQRVGRNARTWAQAHLTHSVLVSQTQALYDRLLSNWRHART